MKSRSVYFSRVLIVVVFCFGCTQQPSESRFESHNLEVGISEDQSLATDKPGSAKKSSREEEKAPSKTASSPKEGSRRVVSEHSNALGDMVDLYEYASNNNNKRLKNAVANQISLIYSKQNSNFFSDTRFCETPYADLFITQSKPQFMSATAGLKNEFEKQKAVISDLMAPIDAASRLLPAQVGLPEAIQWMAQQLTSFEKSLEQSPDVMPAVREGIRSSLYERFWLRLPEAQKILANYSSSTQLTESLKALTEFLAKFEIELEASEIQQIENARQLGKTLSSPLSDRETLAMLIDVWESLTPAEREASFAEASPELNQFLVSSNEKKRECLKNKSCKNLFLKFVRSAFILPKLRKFGLERIQAQVNQSAIQTLDESTKAAARAALVGLAQRLKAEIFLELDKEFSRINGYRDNYDSFARSELQNWFNKKFESNTLLALPKQQFKFAPPFGLTAAGSEAYSPTTYAESLTAVSIAMQSHAGEVSNRSNELGLILANQILAHGGFNLEAGRSYPSILQTQSKTTQSINVERSFYPKGALGYFQSGTVSGFQLTGDGRPKLTLAQRNAFMHGFRNLVWFFRDWNKNVWDSSIKKISAGDFFSSLPTQDIKQAALPKDAFLALALGNLTSLYSDLDRPEGPLFYLCPDGTQAWVGKKQSCSSPTTLVSVADLPTRTAPIIHAKDHAEFLIEVIQFMKLADELQRSRSSYLTRKTSRNLGSPLEQLKASKEKLRELAIGLSNFLSHILTSEEGRVCETYDTKVRSCLSDSFNLSQYEATIRALSISSRYFNMQAYAEVAKLAFDKLNSEGLGANDFYNLEKPNALDYAAGLNMLNNIMLLNPSAEKTALIQRLEPKWRRKLEAAAGL